MNLKSILMVGALSLSSVILLNAKTYEIHLYTPAMAGTVQLPAGDYKLKVDGTNAVLKDTDSNKTYTTAVKVETEDKKFDETAVITDNNNGATHIRSIEIGGSNTKLEFGSE
jgi:hypothetical protein